MPDFRWLLYRLRNLWRRQAREADLDAELQFHLETEAEEQIAAGLPADHARQAARRSLGNITLTKEDARDVWTWGPIERFLQDVRYAMRVLGRQPSFTATALATIVLIVGGTTAVFTLVNSVLLRPLPYPASDRLVIVRAHEPRGMDQRQYPQQGYGQPPGPPQQPIRRSAAEEGRFKTRAAIGVTTYSNLFNINPVVQESDLLIFDDAHGAGPGDELACDR